MRPLAERYQALLAADAPVGDLRSRLAAIYRELTPAERERFATEVARGDRLARIIQTEIE